MTQSALPSSVIVDTSAAYALISATDRHHRSAVSVFNALRGSHTQFFITNYILAEFVNLASSRGQQGRIGRPPVEAFLRATSMLFEIEWIDEPTHQRAWPLVRNWWPDLSFVDGTTAVVAQEFGCAVFTFDNDFRLVGLIVVP